MAWKLHYEFPTTVLADFSLVDSSGDPVEIGAVIGKGLLLYKNGTVCDNSFDENSAETICRLLGYSSQFSWSSGSKWDIQNNYSINMSDVQCSSGDWNSCSYTTNNSCEHSEDIFLACAGRFFTIKIGFAIWIWIFSDSILLINFS